MTGRIVRCSWVMAVAGAWLVAVGITAATPKPQEPAQVAGAYRPPPAPEQPIAYSHKTHINVGLECLECHETASTAEHATLPPTTTCMKCHVRERKESPAIVKLADYDARKEAVPWRRVYQVKDFVWFSHQTHLAANQSITCITCHGDVPNMDVMQKVKDISMAACIQCHKQYTAPILCDTCHEKLD